MHGADKLFSNIIIYISFMFFIILHYACFNIYIYVDPATLLCPLRKKELLNLVIKWIVSVSIDTTALSPEIPGNFSVSRKL